MTKIKECSNCGCIMECVKWNFEKDVASDRNHGDFDCRNCDHTESNIHKNVFSAVGYKSQLLADIPSTKAFDDFLQENADCIREERSLS